MACSEWSLVGLAGILAGDSVIFWAGRRFGVRVAEFKPLRRIVTPEKLEKVEKLMRRRGNVVVVLARYLPGMRAPTYFTAGHAACLLGVPALRRRGRGHLGAALGLPRVLLRLELRGAARRPRFTRYILGAMAVVILVLGAAVGARAPRPARAAALPPPPPAENLYTSRPEIPVARDDARR